MEEIMKAFKKGAVYIFCDKCETTTLHMPIKQRKSRMIATIDDKIVALNLRFRCKRCGKIVQFKEKRI